MYYIYITIYATFSVRAAGRVSLENGVPRWGIQQDSAYYNRYILYYTLGEAYIPTLLGWARP
jgi:hypothetical protein